MRTWVAAALLTLATAASAQDKTPPYWASIASGEAMMQSGSVTARPTRLLP